MLMFTSCSYNMHEKRLNMHVKQCMQVHDNFMQHACYMQHISSREMGPPCGPFHLQSSAVTRHFVAPHHPYISACGVDKNYLKWWEIQLAMHCREDSLIDLQWL